MAIPLYTTLTKAKQELRDGRPVPMTPIPEEIRGIIDPDFTPGLGAIHEDEGLGLRCPVRGCGEYHHNLGNHVSHKHREIGGATGLKALLSLAPKTPLSSMTYTAERKATLGRAVARRDAAGRGKLPPRGRKPGMSRADRAAKASVGYRNLRNVCPSQTKGRLWDLYVAVGRSPFAEDARERDPGLLAAAKYLYGTWDNAKLQAGLQPTAKGKIGIVYNKASVLSALGAYAEQHGDLPSSRDLTLAIPLLPNAWTILRHLDSKTWLDAMRRAAIALGLRESRYLDAEAA